VLGGTAPAYLMRRVADHRGAVGHFLQHDRGGADAGAVANPERPQHLRTRADDDVVADRRMALLPALLARWPGTAEGYPVIERAVISNFGGLADNEAHPVIDELDAADALTRMDYDSWQDPTV